MAGKIVFIIGVAGCGKSTVARALALKHGGVFLEGDEYQPPENVAAMAAGIALTDEMRWGWMQDLSAAAKQHSDAGSDVLVACSGLKRIYRDFLRGNVGVCRFVYLDGSYELIRERMARRKGHYMPLSLLESQFETLEPPTPAETDVSRLGIDGTIDQVIDGAFRLALL
ncbi:MAG: gluconokinase [Paracoccaceae bacterium]